MAPTFASEISQAIEVSASDHTRLRAQMLSTDEQQRMPPMFDLTIHIADQNRENLCQLSGPAALRWWQSNCIRCIALGSDRGRAVFLGGTRYYEFPCFCPDCASPMKLVRFISKDSNGEDEARVFYSCVKYPQCKGSARAHLTGDLVEAPVPSRVKAIRKKLADRIKEISDVGVYDRLRETLGIRGKVMAYDLTEAQCEIALKSLEGFRARDPYHDQSNDYSREHFRTEQHLDQRQDIPSLYEDLGDDFKY